MPSCKTVEDATQLVASLISYALGWRNANPRLDPDLNDGVVLNIAPLRKFVPWKEDQKYWNELLDGQYEWSSIGKQLRQLSLVRSPSSFVVLNIMGYHPRTNDKGPSNANGRH